MLLCQSDDDSAVRERTEIDQLFLWSTESPSSL